MTSPDTAEAISGRATGVLFFTGFGSLWICLGLAAMHRLTPLAGVAIAAVAAALILPSMRLMGTKGTNGTDPVREAHVKRVFGIVNTVQWIAIAGVIVLMNIVHRPEYIAPGIALVVGLHLFPLAGLFRYFPHYITGAVLVIWPLAVMLLMPRTEVPSLGSIGTGVILLLSAAYTLAGARRAHSRLLVTSGA